MKLLPVMSGEDLPFNRPTSPQSSLSQPTAEYTTVFLYLVKSRCDLGGHSSLSISLLAGYGSQSEAAVYCCL